MASQEHAWSALQQLASAPAGRSAVGGPRAWLVRKRRQDHRLQFTWGIACPPRGGAAGAPLLGANSASFVRTSRTRARVDGEGGVAVTRRQVARTLRLVAPDAWQRTAVHSETGLGTLRQLLLHAINHLRHHLRFVAEKRAAMTTS